MEERKLIKFGNSSFVVTLPYEWIEKNKLNKGDSIKIVEKQDSIILSANNTCNEKIAEISLDNMPLKLFNKELISYYLKNYKFIKIKGKEILERIAEIKIFKEKLSSIEIIEMNKEYIILKDLTNVPELEINTLINEIVEMEKILFEELIKSENGKKNSLITQLDSNVNRLMFLAYKTINYNLDVWQRPEEVKYEIHYWRMIAAFEQIGDIIKRIARYMKGEDKEITYNMTILLENTRDYFIFITDLLNKKVNLEPNLKIYLDKKQSLLISFEELKDKMLGKINLYLVITQLLKDILGQLDTVVVSIIDLKNF